MSPMERTRARLALLAALLIYGSGIAPARAAEFVMSNSTVLDSNASFVSDSEASAPSGGNVFVNGIRSQDEIVLVDVRGVGTCCDCGVLSEGARVSIYAAADANGCRRWMPSDMQSALAGAPTMSTVVFVHGNRLTAWDAKKEGLAAYRRVVCQATSEAPIRWVIFSWPSTQIRGPLKDVRVKAARTGPAGCQLAWVVDQLPSDTPLTLVGFSFGARIVTGSLHVLGGGSLGHCCLSQPQHPNRRPANVVLMAAAVHSDWLCHNRCHGMAMSQVNQMLLINNCEDPAMKYYRFVTKYGRPQALGCCGPTCISSGDGSKILQRNVACYVGDNHDLFCYLRAPGVAAQIADYAGHESMAVAGM